MAEQAERKSTGVSRRNVVVGTAWAVPAVMTVGAAPAMAASAVSIVTASITSKNFSMGVTVTGWKSGDVLNIQSISGTPSLGWSASKNPIGSHAMTSASITVTGHTTTNPNTPPSTYTITYTVTKNGGGTISGTKIFQY